jgi:excisionase family DNA binding protein
MSNKQLNIGRARADVIIVSSPYLSTAEVAARLAVSEPWVRRLVEAGRLRPLQRGVSRFQFTMTEVEAYERDRAFRERSRDARPPAAKGPRVPVPLLPLNPEHSSGKPRKVYEQRLSPAEYELLVADLRRALREVEQARQAVAVALARREKLLQACHEGGISPRRIATDCGLGLDVVKRSLIRPAPRAEG